jgi:hypothetical protein
MTLAMAQQIIGTLVESPGLKSSCPTLIYQVKVNDMQKFGRSKV